MAVLLTLWNEGWYCVLNFKSIHSKSQITKISLLIQLVTYTFLAEKLDLHLSFTVAHKFSVKLKF